MDFPNTPAGALCLVSACLCGVPCRYDGNSTPVEDLVDLHKRGAALAVCPEVEGGLPVPRPPCERREGRVLGRNGEDFTEQFEAGAAYTLALAQQYGIGLAILKENSPSCGCSAIYDGSFSGKRVPGQGVTAALLQKNGIRVINEYTAQEVFSGGTEFFGLDMPQHPARGAGRA